VHLRHFGAYSWGLRKGESVQPPFFIFVDFQRSLPGHPLSFSFSSAQLYLDKFGDMGYNVGEPPLHLFHPVAAGRKQEMKCKMKNEKCKIQNGNAKFKPDVSS